MKKLQGIVPALLTPFSASGEINERALRSHVDFLIAAGVNGLYPCGTTGEVVLLSVDEREKVAEVVVDEAAGRVTVFVQVGGAPTATVLHLAAHARAIGADGVGVMTPNFYRLPRRALKEFYQTVAASVPDDFPVYLYNIPQCTCNDLTPDLAGELAAECPNVTGIKNSTADLIRIQQLIEATPPGFSTIQGCDKLLLPGLVVGAQGSVSGNANVWPEGFVSLYRHFQTGDLAAARRDQQLINRLADVLRDGACLAHFKAAMRVRSRDMGEVRRPLWSLGPEEEAELKHQLEEVLPV